jgi:uncharacterized RDD family membrane protein YckC
VAAGATPAIASRAWTRPSALELRPGGASVIDGALLGTAFSLWSRWGSDVRYSIASIASLFWGRSHAIYDSKGVVIGSIYSVSDYAVVSLVADAVVCLVAVAYFVVLWFAGGTIGQRILRLRVVRENDRTPDLVRSLIRYIGLVISIVAIFLGLVWVAFDPRRQGWHDKLAGTFVVRG